MDVVQIPRTDVGTEREGISSVLGCSEQDQPVREHGGRHCEHVAKEARIGFRHEADVVETREASGSMDCDVLRSTTGAFRFEMPPKFSRRFATCRVIELYSKIPSAALRSTRSCWSVWIIIKTNPAALFCLIDRGVRPVDSLDPPAALPVLEGVAVPRLSWLQGRPPLGSVPSVFRRNSHVTALALIIFSDNSGLGAPEASESILADEWRAKHNS